LYIYFYIRIFVRSEVMISIYPSLMKWKRIQLVTSGIYRVARYLQQVSH